MIKYNKDGFDYLETVKIKFLFSIFLGYETLVKITK